MSSEAKPDVGLIQHMVETYVGGTVERIVDRSPGFSGSFVYAVDVLAPTGKSALTLDGIGYELDMVSERGGNTIKFANPEIEANQSFMELEKALYSVAEIVINKNRQELDEDDLSVWQRWLVK